MLRSKCMEWTELRQDQLKIETNVLFVVWNSYVIRNGNHYILLLETILTEYFRRKLRSYLKQNVRTTDGGNQIPTLCKSISEIVWKIDWLSPVLRHNNCPIEYSRCKKHENNGKKTRNKENAATALRAQKLLN